jgi:hypothetical protein
MVTITDRRLQQDAPPKKVECEWCGAPSGRPHVTLKKFPIDGLLMCESCTHERTAFGRKLDFWTWLRLFLRSALSEIPVQYRFRHRGVKVRADNATGQAGNRTFRRTGSRT